MIRARANAGFSLVEVMCAVLILGVALVGLAQGLTTALASSKDSELETTAALCAAGQIEQVRADADYTDGESDGDCGDDLPLYHWKQTIKPGGLDGLHEVTVDIVNTRTGEQLYELKTLLFDPDYPSQDEQTRPRSPEARRRERERQRRNR